MLESIKKALGNIGTVLLVILLLPLILTITLVMLSIYGVSAGWRWLFRKLRRDPNVKIKTPQTLKHADEPPYEGNQGDKIFYDFAKEEFVAATDELALQCSGKAGKITMTHDKWESNRVAKETEEYPLTRMLIIKRQIKTEHATALVELMIEEQRNEEGESQYFSHYDGDDIWLIGSTNVGIRIHEMPGKVFDISTGYSHVARIFCAALLSGKGWYNEDTDQLWVELEKYGVWAVKYRANDFGNNDNQYGFRKRRFSGKARRYWFDQKKRKMQVGKS